MRPKLHQYNSDDQILIDTISAFCVHCERSQRALFGQAYHLELSCSDLLNIPDQTNVLVFKWQYKTPHIRLLANDLMKLKPNFADEINFKTSSFLNIIQNNL